MLRNSRLYIDFQTCHGCPRCAASKACRQKAILQIDADEPPILELSRCRDCWLCIPACPYGAVKKAGNGKEGELSSRSERIQALEDQIADLKKRWPAHSVPPSMLQSLDDLEEALERERASPVPPRGV